MRKRSPKQQAASRANGSRSQGPATPQGKRQASKNSLSHGLYAKSLLLPGESEAAFARMAAQLNLRFRPKDALESMFVQRMILAQWRLIRIWSLEQAGMLQENTELTETHPALRDLTAFHNLHGRGRSGSLLQLSEVRYQRQFDRAILQLEHLRKSVLYEIEEANPGTISFQTENPQKAEPKTNPRRPTKNPRPTQTDPPTTQPEPTVPKPEPLQ